MDHSLNYMWWEKVKCQHTKITYKKERFWKVKTERAVKTENTDKKKIALALQTEKKQLKTAEN